MSDMAGAAMPEAAVTAARAPSAAANPGITNNQEAGVDEGDIVKMHGETLVILRRGRLFTVSLKHGGLKPIDSIAAYPPDVDPDADWYDEMLVSGDRVIVIGYSYGRGGTEINRFHIDDAGKLSFEDSYHLRSNDYYSSRNYASRLIGTHLIVYAPLYLPYGNFELSGFLPAVARWNGTVKKSAFVRTIAARHIYLPPRVPGAPEPEVEALHTVSICDLAAPVLSCEATGILGPAGRSFYVSAHAVYVWVTPLADGDKARLPSYVYRLPLDGSAPTAIAVRGAPVDQFSFEEDAAHHLLNVLVRADSAGDAMWAPEHTDGAVALVRIPLSAFGDGTRELPYSHYRVLPTPASRYGDFHNRFVGRFVLYGTGNDWYQPKAQQAALTVVPVAGGAATSLPMGHGIDRIEAMGDNAVVVGSDDHNVYFTAIELGDATPHVGDSYTELNAAQSETRSHAFFFQPDGTDGSGVIGLPVARAARPAYRQLFDNSVAMVFLRRAGHRFVPLGDLAAADTGIVADNCKASCVDWYGNARPIFLPTRTFALLGYEIVEGDLSAAAIKEIRRISFAPTAGPGSARNP